MSYSITVVVISFFFLPLYCIFLRNAVTCSPRSSVTYQYSLLILGFQAFAGLVAICLSDPGPATVTLPGFLKAHFPPASILTLYLDRFSLTMFSFIAFIGLVVYRYSMTYLDGESKHGRFILVLSCAIFSAQALVISGNLILFATCWILLSLTLHVLLEHYPERQRAILAARKKFIISRIGDLFLLVGIITLYLRFHTADIASLFELANSTTNSTDTFHLQIAALCIVGAAICKSAQIPFHTWLPDTLEAPTPVSALMHAGIVNGGGFALIRFSPLFTSAELALNIATCVGGTTAMLGMIVMWTQTSIKKSLAWSTVMQMGFMVLQCGLGAYSLALIHILGHGFYKARAFLLSGTISESKQPPMITHSFKRSIISLLFGIAISVSILWIASSLTGLQAKSWPGGIISLIVLILALAQIAVPQFKANNPNLMARVISCAALLSFVVLSEAGVSKFYGANFAHVTPLLDRGMAGQFIATIVITLFSILALLSCGLPFFAKSRYGQICYSHAVNGFYVGLYADRVVRALWAQKHSKTRPMPISIIGEQ